MTPDEIVSAIVDDGADPEIPPEARDAVARRLFIHGLLCAAHAPVPAMRRRWKLPALSAAAAAVLLGVGLLVFFERETVPSADALVDRARRALESDQHYASRVYVNGEPVQPRPLHWYVRADRWTLSVERPLGTHWFGGDRENMWWLPPRGPSLEFPKSRLPDLPADLDPTLLAGNLYDALADAKSYAFTTVGPENGLVHVQGVRREGPGPRQVDLWIEPHSGRAQKAELTFDAPARRHVWEYVDSNPRPDEFYRPAGHRR